MRASAACVAAALAALGLTAASAATIVKQEPATGQFRIGQRVLVDDGSCPAGQIKEVVDATNRQASAGRPVGGVRRIRHCIHR
jgi:hypothetical protein